MPLSLSNAIFDHYVGTLKQSGYFNQWLEDVPSEAKEGHNWFAMDTGKGARCHCHAKTGELYSEASAFWELGKLLVVYNFAQWFFAAHCAKDIASEIYQNAAHFYEMFKNYKVCIMDADFSWSKFAEINKPLFEKSGNNLRQAAKSFAIFATLYFDPTLYGLPLGTALRGTMIGYLVINPLSFRIFLDRVERWWLPEDLKSKDVREWTVMDQFCSLAHLFNMQRLEKYPQIQDEKKE